MSRPVLVSIGVFLFFVYVFVIVFSGLGWNPLGLEWKFENTGQFGDSFGPLNTFMAGLAAVGALGAFWAQREELANAKGDALAEREISAKRDFENTFFNLVRLFRESANDVEAFDRYGQNPLRGRDALKRILEEQIGPSFGDAEKDRKRYRIVYLERRDYLGHYFRIFYQVVRFVHESDIADKSLYIRVLRATLSNAEIVLLALNCAYGEGRFKFKDLIEEYALLHNISQSDVWDRGLLDLFDVGAFGDRSFSS